MSNVKATVVNTHSHPYESNELENHYSDLKDEFVGHMGDPYEMREALDSDVALVSFLTNHHDDGESFERIRSELEDSDIAYITNEEDSYITYELDEGEDVKRGAIVNSAEGSTELGRHSHICHGFLPHDNELNLAMMDEDEVYEASEEARLNWIAHPFAPNNWMPEEFTRSFLEEAEERDYEAHLGYTTGYSPLVNRTARGELKTVAGLFDIEEGRETNIYDLAEEYDCSLIPELDEHAVLPYRGQGLGISEGEDIQKVLESNRKDIPIEEFKELDVVTKKPWERPSSPFGEGSTFFQFAKQFQKATPLGKLHEDTKEVREKAREESLTTYEGLNAEYLLERAQNPEDQDLLVKMFKRL